MEIDKTILIVDESSTELLCLKSILDRPDRVIVTAESAKQAINLLTRFDFAMAIIGAHLPGRDRFKTAETIRETEATRHVPIVFISPSPPDKELAFQGYDSGPVDYLLHPVEPEVLRRKTEAFCELYTQRVIIEEQRKEIIAKTEQLKCRLDEINVLRSLVPICASCKRIRDDAGVWCEADPILEEASDPRFSRSLCPSCASELYLNFSARTPLEAEIVPTMILHPEN